MDQDPGEDQSYLFDRSDDEEVLLGVGGCFSTCADFCLFQCFQGCVITGGEGTAFATAGAGLFGTGAGYLDC